MAGDEQGLDVGGALVRHAMAPDESTFDWGSALQVGAKPAPVSVGLVPPERGGAVRQVPFGESAVRSFGQSATTAAAALPFTGAGALIGLGEAADSAHGRADQLQRVPYPGINPIAGLSEALDQGYHWATNRAGQLMALAHDVKQAGIEKFGEKPGEHFNRTGVVVGALPLGVATFPLGPAERAQELVEEGVPADAAQRATLANTAFTALTAAVPGHVQGGVIRRVGSGSAIAAGLTAAGHKVEKVALGSDAPADVRNAPLLGWEDAPAVATGGLIGGMVGEMPAASRAGNDPANRNGKPTAAKVGLDERQPEPAPLAQTPTVGLQAEEPVRRPAGPVQPLNDHERSAGAEGEGIAPHQVPDAVADVAHLVATDPEAASRIHAEHPEDTGAYLAAVKERNRANAETKTQSRGAAADGAQGGGTPAQDDGAGQRVQPGGAAGEVGGGAERLAPVSTNRDGLPIRRDHVGLVAGMSQDGVLRPSPAEAERPATASALAEALTRLHGRSIAVEQVAPPDMAAAALGSTVRRLFGRKVVFVRSGDPAMRGAYLGGDTLFINADSDRPHAQVIGHELLHSLRQESPDVYGRLVDALRPAIDEAQGEAHKSGLSELYSEHGIGDLSPERRHEELIADVVGDHFADPGFVRDLQKRLEPSLFRRVAVHALDFFDRLRGRLDGTPGQMGRQAVRFVNDVETVRRAVRQALWDEGRRSTTGPGRYRGIEAYSRDALETAEQQAQQLSSVLRDVTGSDLAKRAAASYLNQPSRNLETGVVATVSSGSLGKMLSTSAVRQSISPQAHMMAVANLDRLFPIALRKLTREDRGGNTNIGAIHHFEVPMPFGQDILRVKILAKEMRIRSQGARLYTVSAVEIGKPASLRGNADGPESQTRLSTPPAGFDDSFARLVEAVKRSGVDSSGADMERPAAVSISSAETGKPASLRGTSDSLEPQARLSTPPAGFEDSLARPAEAVNRSGAETSDRSGPDPGQGRGDEGSEVVDGSEPKPRFSRAGGPGSEDGGAPRESNRDGLPIRHDHVGLVAGMSQDGVTSVHDVGKPRSIDAIHSSGETRPFDLQESHDYHERVEKALLDAGHSYNEAHRAATEAEHARMRQLGFDPNRIEDQARPYYDAAAHRARALGNTTPDVTGEPYRDSGENAMRADGGQPDPRFVLDREGNQYTDPLHGKLLDSIETVTAKKADGSGYAVIDPHSGSLITDGNSLEQAQVRSVRLAAKLGRRRLQARLDAEVPLSQQQLRERYQGRYPEARIGAADDPPRSSSRASEDANSAPAGEGRGVFGASRTVADKNATADRPGIPVDVLAQAVRRALPNRGAQDRVSVVASEDELPADVRKEVVAIDGAEDAPAEGFFNPKTNQVYLLANRIPSLQRAAWVIAHEGGHWGLHNLADSDAALRDTLVGARGNPGVRQLADAIQAERAGLGQKLDDLQATGEALAELNAAQRTGDWSQLRVQIPEGLKPRLLDVVGRYTRQLAAAMNGVLTRILGRSPDSAEAFSDARVRDLLHQSWQRMYEGRERGAQPQGLADRLTLAFSRIAGGGQSAYKRAAAALQMLTRDSAFFQYPISHARYMGEIVLHTDPRMSVATADHVDPQRKSYYDVSKQWNVTMPDGKEAKIYETHNGRVFIDASGLHEGSSGGSALYHAVANYAHNNGKTFIGDPAGLSDTALRRRTENMLNSALKFGTTRHLEPHERQLEGDPSLGVGPLEWDLSGGPLADAANVAHLMQRAHQNLLNAFPEAADLEYNFKHGRYEKISTGEPVGPADFELAPNSSRGARAAGAGRRTLERAAVINTLLRGAGSAGWHGLLEEISRRAGSVGRLDPELHGIGYSRNRTPPRAGSTVSGVSGGDAPLK
ncbi:MAG: hypothetical protein P4L83_20250 [Nevskia sp.]|nr:hypothetical protein [Nevskia sp.]